jgi:hypothetical protein
LLIEISHDAPTDDMKAFETEYQVMRDEVEVGGRPRFVEMQVSQRVTMNGPTNPKQEQDIGQRTDR